MEQRKTLILMMGPQGSGKTTYSKHKFSNFLRISYDEQGRDHRRLFDTAIEIGVNNILVDKTNPSKKARARFIDLARKHNYYIEIVWMYFDRKVCKERILKRKNHETLKPEKADEALDQYFRNIETPEESEYNIMTTVIA